VNPLWNRGDWGNIKDMGKWSPGCANRVDVLPQRFIAVQGASINMKRYGEGKGKW